MKKKIGIFAVVAVLIITWFVLANKFEDKVRTVYLPILQEKKEKGLIEVDFNNIEIHKYKFAVAITNFVIFPQSDIFQTKLDGISFFYNPLTKNLSVSSSGDRVSIGSGETEMYIANPSFSTQISGSVFQGNMNDIRVTFNTAPQQFLRSADQLPLMTDKGASYEITGKLDKKTNQYLLKLVANTKGISITRDYFKWSHQLTSKNFKITQESQLLTDFLNDIAADYYYATVPDNLIDSSLNVSIAADKSHLENIFKFIQGKIRFEELASNLAKNFNPNKELFDIAILASYGNSLFNNKLSFNLSGDTKDVKGSFDIQDNKNYPKDKGDEIAKLTAELLSKIFNKITEDNLDKSKKLTAEDFMNLANSLIEIKNTEFSTNLTYEIKDSIADANLHFNINEYSIDLEISNKDKERYHGLLVLSDPFKIINAKTKFAHEIVLPLVEKISGEDKTNLNIMQKYISNIESNAFEALKVFSKIPELTQGDKFEADFSYEPKSFSLKINNKSFLEIITDEKIVKFLRGFYTQEDKQDLPKTETSNEDNQESITPDEEIPASSTNNNIKLNSIP
ncbi:MAG: hypothetical protein H6910_03580 [Rickettsiaceae bacterium]|nr:hypothetical protein [Rickettsiaceae bacterium]MCP5378179.1 hypothetical protein [Rickettsiaceae bacterium]